MNENLEYINLSKIETFFDKLLRNKVSKNIFMANMPSVIQDSWKDFIVVDCSYVVDMDAYGKGTVLLLVYAPSMTDGRKNVAAFSSIEKKLNQCIANNKDPHYRIQRRNTYGDYDSQKNMFVNIIEITLMIL